jgi:hypothetical protein
MTSSVDHRLVLLRQNVGFLARDPCHGSSLALFRHIRTIASPQAVVYTEAHGLQAGVLQPLDTTLPFEFLQVVRFADLDLDVLDSPKQAGGEFAQVKRVVVGYVQVADGSGVLGDQSSQERVHTVAVVGHGEREGRFCEGLQGGFVVDLSADLEEVHRHLVGLVQFALDRL